MVNAALRLSNDVGHQPEDARKLEYKEGAASAEARSDQASVRGIARTSAHPSQPLPPPSPSTLTQYLEKRFSIIEAANVLMPVWRELVLHPASFFGEIRQSPNLQFRAALHFCWLSSLCAVAFFITACLLHKYLFGPTPETELAGPFDLFNTVIIEISMFVIFLSQAAGISSVVWLSILTTFKRVPFKPILIAGMYTYVFIMTIEVMLETSGRLFLGASLPFNYLDAYDRLSDLTEPSWAVQGYLVGGAIWSQFVVPMFTTLAISYASGIRPRRILMGGMLLSAYVIVTFYASALTLVYFGVV